MTKPRSPAKSKPKAAVSSDGLPDPRRLGIETLSQIDGQESDRRTVSEAMAITDGLAGDAAMRAHHVAARRLALQLLYEIDATGSDLDSIGAALDGIDDLGPLMRSRVETLVRGAWRSRSSIDSLLAELSPQWPPSRQPAVDRAILRLVVFEMSSGMTVPSIAINEAVELAHSFSTERSGAFINGVLSKATGRLDEIAEDEDPFADSADRG